MATDETCSYISKRKIFFLRSMVILLAFLLLGSLYVIDDYIGKYNSCRAELFIRQMVVLISSNLEDYKEYCDDKDIANIEANKDKITGNYKIIDSDRDASLLWWQLTDEIFRYTILFNQQDIFDIEIDSFPDGKFKVCYWFGPREQKGNEKEKIKQ